MAENWILKDFLKIGKMSKRSSYKAPDHFLQPSMVLKDSTSISENHIVITLWYLYVKLKFIFQVSDLKSLDILSFGFLAIFCLWGLATLDACMSKIWIFQPFHCFGTCIRILVEVFRTIDGRRKWSGTLWDERFDIFPILKKSFKIQFL